MPPLPVCLLTCRTCLQVPFPPLYKSYSFQWDDRSGTIQPDHPRPPARPSVCLSVCLPVKAPARLAMLTDLCVPKRSVTQLLPATLVIITHTRVAFLHSIPEASESTFVLRQSFECANKSADLSTRCPIRTKTPSKRSLKVNRLGFDARPQFT